MLTRFAKQSVVTVAVGTNKRIRATKKNSCSGCSPLVLGILADRAWYNVYIYIYIYIERER